MRNRIRRVLVLGLASLLAACNGVSQRIEKGPSAVYEAFESNFSSSESSGTAMLEGRSVPTQLKVDKVPGKALDAIYLVDGDEVARVHLSFASASGGAATDVGGTLHVEPGRFPDDMKLPIPSKLPQFALDQALASMLKTAARQIEETGSLGAGGTPFEAARSAAAAASSADSQWARRERQEAATAPTTDLGSWEQREAMRNATRPGLDASRPTLDASRPTSRGY
jgi:hypothetical protein